MALVTGAHIGYFQIPESHFQVLVNMAQDQLPALRLCDSITLMWRLISLSERSLPKAFMQAFANQLVARFAEAVETVGGVQGVCSNTNQHIG